MSRFRSRREFLSLMGVSGLSGLAGCGGPFDTSSSASPVRTESPANTASTTDTEDGFSTATTETASPVIEAYDVSVTSSAGELEVELEASDSEQLGRAIIETSVDEVDHSLEGQQDTIETRVNGSPGEVEQIRFLVKDAMGNTTRQTENQYVRKYDVIADTRLDIGVDYFQLGEDMFTKCLESGVDIEPTIEDYGAPIHPETTSKHVDMMQGYGIGRVRFTFGGSPGEFQMLENFMKANLIDDISVSAGYYVAWDSNHRLKGEASWPEIVEADMPIIREKILSRNNVDRYKGRPIFMVSNAGGGWNGHHDRIMENWGSYENFVDEIRSFLSVDGTDPFMVAGYGSLGYNGYGDIHEDLATQFDAVTTGKAAPVWRDNDISVEDTVLFVEQNFQGHREFTDDHDMEFIPQVFPGFDDRANTCWGDDRHTPRSPERFRQLLQLADKYRTTEMINIETWNDWTEGTQLEPGTFRGNNYGTGYLEIIKEFQRSSN